MNIAFCYNIKHQTNYSTQDNQEDIEFDSIDVIDNITKAIKSLGHTVIKIEADINAFDNLRLHKHEIDLVFNIAEGLSGDARESQIPIFCEMLNIPYTHSSPTTHAIKLNKHLTKTVLYANGVLCPKSIVVTKSNQESLKDYRLEFPLIVKPNKQGSSKGIFNDSVVKDEIALHKAVKRVLDNFDTEAIVEQYIEGREFTVAVIDNPFEVLPVIEQKFDFLPKGFNKVAGYELKWIYEDAEKDKTKVYDCPAILTIEQKRNIEKTTKIVWDTLDVKDVARLDFRLDSNNKLYFIEINTLPGINPDQEILSYLPASARASGMSFESLINRIIESAKKRYNF